MPDVIGYDAITSGFMIEGYAIDTYVVPFVDNEGEQCQHCQRVGHDISCTVYGVVDGVVSLYECCLACVPMIVRAMEREETIVIEVGLTGSVVCPSDRMAHQDDERPHSDAL